MALVDKRPVFEAVPLAARFPRLKRALVAPFFWANALAAGYAALQVGINVLGKEESGLSWLVAMVTHAAVVVQAGESWPSRSSGKTSLIATSGIGLVALALLRPRNDAALTSVALLGGVGSVLYAGWFAAYGRRPSAALTVGARMPDIELRHLDGSIFRTADLRGRPAALFFIRGNWCPFCSAQIRSVVAEYGTLAQQGVQVVIISPQPEEESRLLAEKFGVDVLWLRDADLQAAKRLEIFDQAGVPIGTAAKFGVDTLMPTLVVLDADLTILGVDETDSFRVRPEPLTVLRILNRRATTLQEKKTS